MRNSPESSVGRTWRDALVFGPTHDLDRKLVSGGVDVRFLDHLLGDRFYATS